jgi:hypothetical protein
VENNTDAPPFAQDFAAALADGLLLDARQVALDAITDALSSPALRNHFACVIRDELAARAIDIAAEYRPSDD